MFRRPLAFLLASAALFVLWFSAFAAPGAALQGALYLNPPQPNGGTVQRLTVEVRHTGGATLPGAELNLILPEGFRYQAGSALIRHNGTLVGRGDPAISGQQLRWTELAAPPAVTHNAHGIHTFVQERCGNNAYVEQHLDRARELMGPGAWVKQLFYGITPGTMAAQPCWRFFVNAAYDRGLRPIVRLQGPFDGANWQKPPADSPGNYTGIAAAFARVVADLPRRGNEPLFVEIWNEPNLHLEWSGAANPVEFGAFLRDTAAAIRALGDPRVQLLNGALSPGGQIPPLAFIDGMASVPGALEAFDLWATHPYPGNHPPEYNLHDGTARHTGAIVDSYLLELDQLRAHGRSGLRVILTETGYALGANDYGWEGYPPIDEDNRADYINRALGTYWQGWPEVYAVTPYELVDPNGGWAVWDWRYPFDAPHRQYEVVAGRGKSAKLVPGTLSISVLVTTPANGGRFTLRATGGTAAERFDVSTPLTINGPALTPVPTSTPTRTPTRTPSPTPTIPAGTPIPDGAELIRNGGFERREAWTFGESDAIGDYVESPRHTGEWAARLGIVPPTAAVWSYSSLSQPITIPVDASSATLSLWLQPHTEDQIFQPGAVPAGTSHDAQQILLLDESRQYLATLWSATLEGGDTWQPLTLDLTPYRGRMVWLYLNAFNDGDAQRTWLFADDVSVIVRRPGAPTVTATATATPSRTPGPSPSATRTPTSTQSVPSATPSATETASPTPSATGTATATGTASPTGTPDATASATGTAGATETATPTPSTTGTPDASPTASPTKTSSATPSPTGTRAPTRSPTPTRTKTPTASPTPTRTKTPMASPTPTRTKTPTASPTPTVTPTVTRSPNERPRQWIPFVVRRAALAPSEAPPPLGALTVQSGSARAEARLVDEGVEIRRGGQRFRLPSEAPLWAVALAPDGRQVAASSRDGRLLVWDAVKGAVPRTVEGLTRPAGLAWWGETLVVADPAEGRVAFLRPPTYAIVRNVTAGEAPALVTVAPATGRHPARLFVADQASASILAFDEALRLQWRTQMPGLGTINSLAFDAAADRLLVAYPLSGRHIALTALETATGNPTPSLAGATTPTLTGPGPLTLDPTTNRWHFFDGTRWRDLDPIP